MPTFTTNYSLDKPLVNDPTDEDLWGGYLNGDMDDIDTLLRAGITIDTQTSQTTGFTATATISVKNLYPCDATSGAFAATLPTALAAGDGATVFFKKTDSSSNAITVTRASTDTIDGATTKVLSNQWDTIGLVSDGVSSWNSIIVPAPTAFVTAVGYGILNTGGSIALDPSLLTNSLSGDVNLSNTANYFDGASVAQGSTGTWFASGTVSVTDSATGSVFHAKLWDGTTVVASGWLQAGTANGGSISLSGYLASPAGNLRISVRDTTTTGGKILFNQTGNSKDSTISAIRLK